MAQDQPRKPQSNRIEDARDLQQKLYREIGISAVAAALRFTSQSESPASGATGPLPGVLRGDTIAA